MSRGRRNGRAAEGAGGWLIAVEAFVADVSDSEGMHRIRVVIPSMDENIVHDVWAAALTPWVGPNGYGPVNLPEIGSEVLLFGRLGQKHSLFYLCRFNEDCVVPGEFVGDGARGLKTDGKYKLLADLLIKFISQSQVDVEAPLVRLIGGESEVVRVEPNKIGFLGASAIARRPLPGPAIDLESCKQLTNAIRTLLIDVGLAS